MERPALRLVASNPLPDRASHRRRKAQAPTDQSSPLRIESQTILKAALEARKPVPHAPHAIPQGRIIMIEDCFDHKEIRRQAWRIFRGERLWVKPYLKVELWILEEIKWSNGESECRWTTVPFPVARSV